MGRAAKTLGLAAALALGACAPSRFVCPARGGPPWREVSSEHFVLETDVGPDTARDMVRDLEFVRAALVQAMFGRSIATPARLEVVAFRSQGELAEYATTDTAGRFQVDALGRQRILLADLGPPQRQLIAHELAHYLSFQVIQRQPPWFAEGVATYYETVAKRGLFQKPQVGAVPDGMGPWLLRHGPWPTTAILIWRQETPANPGFYATSWLLVQFLRNQHGDRFTAFQTRLARAEDPMAAWNATFPEWRVSGGTEKLDVELDAYLRRGTFRYHELSVEVAPTVVDRPMSPGEVHALRLSIPRGWPEGALEAEVDEALAEDAGNVEALKRLVSLSRIGAIPAARRAVEAHPDAPRAWGFLAEALAPTHAVAEREAALRKAVALAPDDLEGLVALGAFLRDARRPAEALATASRAVEMAPWSQAALLLHAAILADLGRCADAVAASRRAVDLTGEGYSPEARQESANLARQIGERCPVRGSDPR